MLTFDVVMGDKTQEACLLLRQSVVLVVVSVVEPSRRVQSNRNELTYLVHFSSVCDGCY